MQCTLFELFEHNFMYYEINISCSLCSVRHSDVGPIDNVLHIYTLYIHFV